MHFIEKIKQKQREKNIKIIREELDSKWVVEKIQNHLERNPYLNLSVKDIQNSILNNNLIASFFIKDPGKQNISENSILGLIEDIKEISNLLKASDLKLHYVINNKYIVFDSENLKPKNITNKSLDFSFTYKNIKFIGTQKYTSGTGGAQDNQYNDVQSFLNNSLYIENYIPVALVDGNYYTSEKINVLKSINPNAIVCGIDNLEVMLIEKTNN